MKKKKNNITAAAHSIRGPSGSGKHKNKYKRGSGKIAGKYGRHPKHKNK